MRYKTTEYRIITNWRRISTHFFLFDADIRLFVGVKLAGSSVAKDDRRVRLVNRELGLPLTFECKDSRSECSVSLLFCVLVERRVVGERPLSGGDCEGSNSTLSSSLGITPSALNCGRTDDLRNANCVPVEVERRPVFERRDTVDALL
jgi:hypothetical protein